jgi:DNA-binding transcriptional ArsR family regulator
MDVDVAAAARLFADPTRADVLAALLDGRALTAGELARATGVSAQTVSAHLRRLLDARLVAVQAQGRHRYYHLADDRAGRAFEALAALAPVRPARSLRQSRIAADLRMARTCYDHLAGAVAVHLADSLTRHGVLAVDQGRYRLGPAGTAVLTSFGLDMSSIALARRSLAHPCLDWSERRHHVAGALGAALLTRMTDLGWISPHPASRAVRLHETGRQGLSEIFGCELPSESQAAAANHAASRPPLSVT